ncbi:MAG: protein kinase [Elusimicrobia bacterium]|nr:protein kinase [Elusimicrobiota bacterium]
MACLLRALVVLSFCGPLSHAAAGETTPAQTSASSGKVTTPEQFNAAIETRVNAVLQNEAAVRAFMSYISSNIKDAKQVKAALVTGTLTLERLAAGQGGEGNLENLRRQVAANMNQDAESALQVIQGKTDAVGAPVTGTPAKERVVKVIDNAIAQATRVLSEPTATPPRTPGRNPSGETPAGPADSTAKPNGLGAGGGQTPTGPGGQSLAVAGGEGAGGSSDGYSGESAAKPAIVDVLGQYAIAAKPNDPRSWELSARAAWRKGDMKTAYAEIERAIAGGRVGPSSFLLRAITAEQLGDFEKANRDARLTLEFDPRNQRARDLLHMTDGKISQVHLSESQSPWSPDAPAGEAGSAQPNDSARGGAVDPGAIIAAVQSKSPGDPRRVSDNLVREARRYLDLKDPRAVVALAAKAVDLNPQNPAAYHVKAVAESQLGRLTETVRDSSLSLALVSNPRDALPALKTRAWAYNSLRKYDDALKDSLQAKSIKPGDGFVLMSEARALGGLGRREEMVERLRQAAQLEPQRYEGLYDAALELPSDADTEALFSTLPAASRGAPGSPPKRGQGWHWARLVLYCLAGGLLIAVGLSHREVAATTRRLLTGVPAASTEEIAAASAPVSGVNFWARYDSPKEIAKGGMGVVYLATDKSLGRRVAVKKMREELRTDPRERERFLKEARTVAGLQHPNIVQIFEIAEDGMDAYLVFEYVDGETLHDRRKRLGRFAFADAVKALRPICEAIEFAHGRGLTHRDLKPANVMIDSEDRVKVMDFGIARQAKDALAKSTSTQTVVGTPLYMAPEQEAGVVRPESDLYSLGACLYEMLTGNRPFPAQATTESKKAKSYTRPSRVTPLPPEVDALIDDALEPDPEKRIRTALEFAARLKALPVQTPLKTT